MLLHGILHVGKSHTVQQKIFSNEKYKEGSKNICSRCPFSNEGFSKEGFEMKVSVQENYGTHQSLPRKKV